GLRRNHRSFDRGSGGSTHNEGARPMKAMALAHTCRRRWRTERRAWRPKRVSHVRNCLRERRNRSRRRRLRYLAWLPRALRGRDREAVPTGPSPTGPCANELSPQRAFVGIVETPNLPRVLIADPGMTNVVRRRAVRRGRGILPVEKLELPRRR